MCSSDHSSARRVNDHPSRAEVGAWPELFVQIRVQPGRKPSQYATLLRQQIQEVVTAKRVRWTVGLRLSPHHGEQLELNGGSSNILQLDMGRT